MVRTVLYVSLTQPLSFCYHHYSVGLGGIGMSGLGGMVGGLPSLPLPPTDKLLPLTNEEMQVLLGGGGMGGGGLNATSSLPPSDPSSAMSSLLGGSNSGLGGGGLGGSLGIGLGSGALGSGALGSGALGSGALGSGLPLSDPSGMGSIDQAVSVLAGQVTGLGLGQGLGTGLGGLPSSGMDPLLSGLGNGNGSSSSVGGSVLGTSLGEALDTPLGTTAVVANTGGVGGGGGVGEGANGGEGGAPSANGSTTLLPSSQPAAVVELVTKPTIIERMALVNVDVLTATLPTVFKPYPTYLTIPYLSCLSRTLHYTSYPHFLPSLNIHPLNPLSTSPLSLCQHPPYFLFQHRTVSAIKSILLSTTSPRTIVRPKASNYAIYSWLTTTIGSPIIWW